MNKLLYFVCFLVTISAFSQKNGWKLHSGTPNKITKDKGVTRESFPTTFKLYDLDITPLRQILFSNIGKQTTGNQIIISLPNVIGELEEFEVFEASNFEPDLQAQFPQIRAYSGKGITDRYATLKLSISPQGIQTMVFRADKQNEFIEPYSKDHTVYAVFKSNREKGKLPWTCSTQDNDFVLDINSQIFNTTTNKANTGQLKTMRLAQSCNGEYANYFGASTAGTAADQVIVLSAFNATLTRCNGVYEKDLALHLNLVASSTNIIFYNPTTDPYTLPLANWNTQLQNTISSRLTGIGTTLAANNAAYDIGHMFGATGGGGNAGCIGCVCVDDTASTTDKNKGSGITSPNNGIPQGDSFDIDYVAHEVGHQLGGNHTFSHNNEGAGVNKEVGSGVTVMGYAGITSQDVAPHSIDSFHETSIAQIQANLASKTCPITTSLSGINATPVVSPVSNYTIPKSTPFILTGQATDANPGDALTYSWEQNDDGGANTGAASNASATKIIGPNFISWSPTASPSRYFPKLTSVIANSPTTAQVGGDAGMLSEALSSVARTLNFRLTVRDNVPYNAAIPTIGQTNFTDMVVTVNGTAGPFTVSAPNTNVSWQVGSNQNVTWAVAGTTTNGVNCNYVDIYLSTDGGNTYPILLASKVPNDGIETITIPNTIGTSNRIMVRGYKHIFFDISNANFTIVASATPTFALAFSGLEDGQNKAVCQSATASYNLNYSTLLGYSTATTFSIVGNPVGSIATFSPSTISTDGVVNLVISNTQLCTPGLYTMVVTGTSGAITKTVNLYLEILNSSFAVMSLTSPANLAYAQPTNITLAWVADAAATMYDVQVARDSDFTNIIVNTTVATNSYLLSGLTENANYFWKVVPKNSGCSGNYSIAYRFTTGQQTCSSFISTNIPLAISASGTPTINSTLTIPTANNVTISDINVTAQITHTWTSDLTLTLISPAGTQIQLVTGQCADSDNVNATFDDSGATLICATNPAITGTIKPSQLLSLLNGQSSQGVWTLRVFDNANGDGGSLTAWSLNICSVPNVPITCGQIATSWNGTSWTNSKPLDNVAATINGNYTSTENLTACSLNVTGTAQVNILSGHNLTIAGVVDVANTANLSIQNNANLIQTNNVSNVGNITSYRDSNALMRLDYTIWSSPVTGTQTLKQFSPLTLNTRFYNYNTTTNIYYSVTNPLTTVFGLGQGYLIRMPDNHPTTPTIWNGQFTGTPNNGNINIGLNYVGVGQSFNMVGNPYPSTINASSLLTANSATIFGTLYFWRKTNNAAGTAYATYTLGGATTTSPTSPVPNGIIQVGQGFIVEAKNTATPIISFTNDIRVANNSNQFFRENTTIENNRIWLNLTNSSGVFSQTLVGYMTNATQGVDDAIDGKSINDSTIGLTSLINNEEYSVQLRSLPFDNADSVPLSFKTNVAGQYTIAIDHVDGIFEGNQDVYLKDNVMQLYHNLKINPYNFDSQIGSFNSRFELVYQNTSLFTSTFNTNNDVIVYTQNNSIFIESSNEKLQKVIVYDVLGRELFKSNELKNNQLIIQSLTAKNQGLFVKIVLDNGETITRKIIL